MTNRNKKLEKRLNTIAKQVKRLTKLLSNTVGTDFNAPQKKKMKQEKKQQKKTSLHKIESQVKALAAVIAQLASQEKTIEATPIPKEKEDEEEPAITFST
jgi:conjugal transfer/entry exclusion protein